MITGILIVAGILFIFGLVSAKLEHSVVTGPMVFAGLGLILYAAGITPIGDIANGGSVAFFGTELKAASLDNAVRILAEITLVLLLFTDASRIAIRSLFREHRLVLRLLFVALPVSIFLGAAIGWLLFPGAGVIACFICAAILAPTDAALGQAVVSLPKLPLRIRQTLNAESGLNDGIVLPVVLLLVALARTEPLVYGEWGYFISKQLVLGPIIGGGLGYLFGAALQWSTKQGAINSAFERIASIAMAGFIFLGAESIHSNGFIAVFTAGLVLGNFFKQVCHCLYEFAEAEGMLLSLLTFFVFGLWTVPVAIEQTGIGLGTLVVYSFLMLTVMRMAPILLVCFGLELDRVTKLFIGWFGPRGLASVLFMMIIVGNQEVSQTTKYVVYSLVTVTVLMSIVLHGITAYPLSMRYAKYIEDKKQAMEHDAMAEEFMNPTKFGV